MSLILEALKKSEANRRLGQAPDIGTPFTPARRERSPLWALIVIVVSLGAGLWWWLGRATPAPETAVPKPAAAAAPAPRVAAAPAQNQESPQQQDKRIFNTARRQESNAQTPPAAGKDESIWVAAQRRDATGRMARHSAQPEPARAPVTQMPPGSTTAQPVRTPTTAQTQGYASQPQSVPPPPQPHPETAPPMPQPHPDAVTPVPQPHPDSIRPAPAPTAAKLDVPSYFDLPFATRKALPQLSLSMHVYAADPKQRFVILDGARMVEGDTTTDSVTLREIRPDGVVLEFQGQRFFFSRDGL